jgi:hypothetical protein
VKLNIVPARSGIQCVKLGILTFFRQPLALAGLFFMYMAAMLVLVAIPLIGSLVAVMLVPAATLGIMVATEQAASGRFPMPSVLLSAFRAGRQRVRAMLILGGIYAAVSVAIVLIASILITAPPAGESGAPPTPEQAMRAAPVLFLIAAIQSPMFVLFAHAPALVHWHGVSPLKSLFFSLVAFWRNLGAFAMYAITWMLVAFSLLGVVSVLFAVFSTAPSLQAVAPIALLVSVMISTSLYFTFRDCFVDSPEPELPAPPERTDGDNP